MKIQLEKLDRREIQISCCLLYRDPTQSDKIRSWATLPNINFRNIINLTTKYERVHGT